MLFGRKDRPENVKTEALIPLLNAAFDKKVGTLRNKTAGIVNELHSARLQFVKTCEDFEKLDAEPDTENIYFANTHFIKSQKGPYAQTLKRLASEMSLKPEKASNTYEECAEIASNTEDMLNKILKVNATFKQVMMCYSNHLTNFKRSFSTIERLAKEARNELDKRSGDFSEYRVVKEAISRYERNKEELALLRKDVEAIRKVPEPNSTGDGRDERKASEDLAAKKAELAKIKDEISNLHGRIAMLTGPLERASKKFDYASVRKKQLHTFIEDPMTASADADYKEFMALVKELETSVESGAIEVKNKAEVVGLTSELLHSDLQSKILATNSLESRRSELGNEIRALEMTLDDLKGDKITSEKRARDAEELERRAKEIERQRDSAKSMIERLFKDYYGKTLLIE